MSGEKIDKPNQTVTIIRWCAAALLALMGLAMLTRAPVVCLTSLLLAFLVSPLVYHLYSLFPKVKFTRPQKIGIAAAFGVLWLLSATTVPTPPSETAENVAETVEEEIKKDIEEARELPVEAAEIVATPAPTATPSAAPKPTPTPTPTPKPTPKPTPTPAPATPKPSTPTPAPATPKPAAEQPAPAPVETNNLPFKATCKDGTTSYQDDASKGNYQGMCSGHGGIKDRLGRVP
jgi:outer membrane biosynthesis protein TonB